MSPETGEMGTDAVLKITCTDLVTGDSETQEIPAGEYVLLTTVAEAAHRTTYSSGSEYCCGPTPENGPQTCTWPDTDCYENGPRAAGHPDYPLDPYLSDNRGGCEADVKPVIKIPCRLCPDPAGLCATAFRCQRWQELADWRPSHPSQETVAADDA